MTNLIAALTPGEIQGMVDHAARQSDRYLFVVVIVVLVVLLIVYGIYQTKWVRSLVDEMRSDRRASDAVIQANTIAMTRVCDRLQ